MSKLQHLVSLAIIWTLTIVYTKISDIDNDDITKFGIARNTFHDGYCIDNLQEIVNDDGISRNGANGYHFDDYNCSHNLLAMDSHSISHLLVADTNFVDTDCTDNYRILHFQDEAPF